MDNDCLFCRIVAGEIPATVVHETDTTLAFRDIGPKAPVHVLVIPKDHHTDVVALARADPKAAADVLAAAAAVAEAEGLRADGFRLIFNTGAYGGQEVDHVHAHVVGGEAFATRIDSDVTDYRYATRMGGEAKLSAVELPDATVERVRILVEDTAHHEVRHRDGVGHERHRGVDRCRGGRDRRSV